MNHDPIALTQLVFKLFIHPFLSLYLSASFLIPVQGSWTACSKIFCLSFFVSLSVCLFYYFFLSLSLYLSVSFLLQFTIHLLTLFSLPKDIDECSFEEGGPCQHVCTNTPGAFLCSCYSGFILEEDGVNCRAEVRHTAGQLLWKLKERKPHVAS